MQAISKGKIQYFYDAIGTDETTKKCLDSLSKDLPGYGTSVLEYTGEIPKGIQFKEADWGMPKSKFFTLSDNCTSLIDSGAFSPTLSDNWSFLIQFLSFYFFGQKNCSQTKFRLYLVG